MTDDIFGEVISSYGIQQAIEDGNLYHIDFITPGTWAITMPVFDAIEKAKDSRTIRQRIVNFMHDVLLIIQDPANRGETMITEGMEGNITGETVWIAMNETGGWTVMFPSDY